MKLLYVIQSYGVDVFSGAETYTRMMAERMAQRGHEIHVVTSCARSYYDWANHYEAGTQDLNGVTVHRLAVDKPRNHRLFGPLTARVMGGPRPAPLYLQQRWTEMQGPSMPEFEQWLWDNAPAFDAVVFNTYLYYPVVRGLPLVAGRVPTIMTPLAHDEPYLFLSLFDTVFKQPTGYVYMVPEEEQLIRRRANPSAISEVIGIGVDQDVEGNGQAFREAYGIGDSPYIVYVGRLDPAKGCQELYDFFVSYKTRRANDLKLVLVGEPLVELPARDDVITTGFVPAQTKYDALAGALVSVHPSYYESFSMTLTEAWVQKTPALVNGRCDVLAGQARRSNGGLSYSGYADFEVAVDMLLEEPRSAQALGANGQAYVEYRYRWDSVMDRYERFISRVPKV